MASLNFPANPTVNQTYTANGSTWRWNGKAWVTANNLSYDQVVTALGFLPEDAADKGQTNGYASLDGTGKVPAGQLPSYVDDVLEYSALAAFPATGAAGVIYVAIDTNKTYRWSGTAYIEISASPGTTDSVSEGSTNLYFTQARARSSVSAGGSLSYNASTGVFSYTQPSNVSTFTNDAGYLTSFTETDPTVPSHVKSITATNISNWNTAYGWGNHASAGYLTGITSGQVTTALGFTPANKAGDTFTGDVRALTTYGGDTAYDRNQNPFEWGGASASFGLSIQDGSGRVNYYWNSNGGVSPTQTVANEDAFRLNMTDGPVMEFYGWEGSSSAAGTPITWTSVFRAAMTEAAPTFKSQVILHAGNYNSYSPTLTGTGASGTWAISVSGNAATVSSITSGQVTTALGYTPANKAGDTFTGAITVNSGSHQVIVGSDGAIELTRSGGGAYIDLKDSTSEDYDVRLQASGNQLGIAATGGLTLNGSAVLTGITSGQVTTALGYTPPQPNGTGASGTWGISITGNAATVSNITRTTNAGADVNSLTTSGFYRINGSEANRPADWGQMLTVYGGSDTIGQLYFDYLNGDTISRAGNPSNVGGSGSWSSWRRNLNDGNYTNYTVTKTGSGASGSWGISVTGSSASCTGNAATATLATKASTLSQNGANGAAMTFNWSGQGGQPNWLWGGSDGTNMYVYNPSNFSVNYATSAGSANALNSGNSYSGYNFTASNTIYASNWFRTYGSTGIYNETNARGWVVAEDNASYGNYTVYGAGRNGWQGVSIGTANKTILMTDGNTWGMYNTTSAVWMMNSDMAGNVTFSGNVTAYSDLRLKHNVREIDNVTTRRDVLASSAIKYERDGRTRIGYGAQYLRDRGCPEFVIEADDAMKLATGEGTLSVDYGETAAVLAVASKNTDNNVAALEERIAALEAIILKLNGDKK